VWKLHEDLCYKISSFQVQHTGLIFTSTGLYVINWLPCCGFFHSTAKTTNNCISFENQQWDNFWYRKTRNMNSFQILLDFPFYNLYFCKTKSGWYSICEQISRKRNIFWWIHLNQWTPFIWEMIRFVLSPQLCIYKHNKSYIPNYMREVIRTRFVKIYYARVHLSYYFLSLWRLDEFDTDRFNVYWHLFGNCWPCTT
jgi:hypothetical protein